MYRFPILFNKHRISNKAEDYPVKAQPTVQPRYMAIATTITKISQANNKYIYLKVYKPYQQSKKGTDKWDTVMCEEIHPILTFTCVCQYNQ